MLLKGIPASPGVAIGKVFILDSEAYTITKREIAEKDLPREIARFEDAGYKIVGMKFVWADEDFAKRHYTEDLAIRRGEHVRARMVRFIREGPVVAMALEGVNSIEGVRKIVGETEPRKAAPGTIRGDFAHVSYAYPDSKEAPVKNLIHASADAKDAARAGGSEPLRRERRT